MAKKPEELGFLGLKTSTYGREIPKFVEKTGWGGLKEKAGKVGRFIAEKAKNIVKRIDAWGKENPIPLDSAASTTPDAQIPDATIDTTEAGGGETKEAPKKIEAVKVQAEEELKNLEEARKALEQRAKELEAQAQEIQEQIKKIEEFLKKMASGTTETQAPTEAGKDNKEAGVELKGTAAIAWSLKKVPDSELDQESKKWLSEKFTNDKANTADIAFALGVLEETPTDGWSEADKKIHKSALEHLNEKARENSDWKQPEGKVSDWLELQAHLNKDEKALKQVEDLRKVMESGDKSQVETTKKAIQGLRKDRNLRGKISLEACGQLNSILNEAESAINKKEKN